MDTDISHHKSMLYLAKVCSAVGGLVEIDQTTDLRVSGSSPLRRAINPVAVKGYGVFFRGDLVT